MRQTLHPHPKKKKPVVLIVLLCLLAAALAVGAVLFVLSHRDPVPQEDISQPEPSTTVTTRPTLPQSFIDRNTASKHAVLYDNTAGTVLYSKDADGKAYPASLTKILTALVAVENTPADTVFTVGSEVRMIDPESSRAYLTVGTKLELANLLQAMLLPSGNDAAYVLAVQVGRTLSGNDKLDNKAALKVFTDKMNETAQALGCTGSHFINPDGIHHADHYTTANDMLKISAAALKHPLLAETFKTPEVRTRLITGQSVHWVNSNKLLHEDSSYYYKYATGLKTGSTDEAGRCLAASAVKDGRETIVILLGSPTEQGRWEDAKGLLEISFQ